jgi:hypothetical protein
VRKTKMEKREKDSKAKKKEIPQVLKEFLGIEE